MKSLLLPAVLLGLAMGTAQASEIFTLTDTPNEVINTGNSHWEEAFNFTSLPGWNQNLIIDSVEVTETFSNIAGGSTFSSTIIPYSTLIPNSGSAVFTLFSGQSLNSTTKTVTENVPSPLTVADITTAGVLGEFDTRVSRFSAGSFTLDSVSISITAETPEPATFAMMGLGLAAAALFAKRRSA